MDLSSKLAYTIRHVEMLAATDKADSKDVRAALNQVRDYIALQTKNLMNGRTERLGVQAAQRARVDAVRAAIVKKGK